MLSATFKALLIVAAGAGLGLLTAGWATSGRPPFGAVRSGPWVAYPQAGGADADPYIRAARRRGAGLPWVPAAGLRFVATTDRAGATLRGACRYRVAGATPPAEDWTLTLLAPDGLPVPGAARAGLTSTEVLRDASGRFAVTVAPGVQPGNWLPGPDGQDFVLMLGLYDTPLVTALRMGGAAPSLPAIERVDCP